MVMLRKQRIFGLLTFAKKVGFIKDNGYGSPFGFFCKKKEAKVYKLNGSSLFEKWVMISSINAAVIFLSSF